MIRLGIGFDIHPLVENRPLILGGVSIPSALGLDGHSDADVLIHALMDSLLGAAALGDIGIHFPPDDPQYSGIASTCLLKQTMRLVTNAGLHVVNVDATIIAQRPTLAPYYSFMCESVAGILVLPRNRVSIKSSTTQGLGIIGAEKAIATWAVASLEG